MPTSLPCRRRCWRSSKWNSPIPRCLNKLRNYLQKWRPMRMALPMSELDALGVPRGPKFDKIMEQLFDMQLRGKGKLPEERVKIFRQLAGIKDEPKKKPEKEKKKRGEKGAVWRAARCAGGSAAKGSGREATESRHSGCGRASASFEGPAKACCGRSPAPQQKAAAKPKAQPAKKASRR